MSNSQIIDQNTSNSQSPFDPGDRVESIFTQRTGTVSGSRRVGRTSLWLVDVQWDGGWSATLNHNELYLLHSDPTPGGAGDGGTGGPTDDAPQSAPDGGTAALPDVAAYAGMSLEDLHEEKLRVPYWRMKQAITAEQADERIAMIAAVRAVLLSEREVHDAYNHLRENQETLRKLQAKAYPANLKGEILARIDSGERIRKYSYAELWTGGDGWPVNQPTVKALIVLGMVGFSEGIDGDGSYTYLTLPASEEERRHSGRRPPALGSLINMSGPLPTPPDYRAARGVLADVADEPAEVSIRRQRDAEPAATPGAKPVRLTAGERKALQPVVDGKAIIVVGNPVVWVQFKDNSTSHIRADVWKRISRQSPAIVVSTNKPLDDYHPHWIIWELTVVGRAVLEGAK